MNAIDSFVERYKKTKEEFSKFVEKENIEGKAKAAVTSLLEREQRLLAKGLGITQDSLVEALSLKMKTNSLILGTQSEKYNLTLEKVLSSGYSTNYDLDLQKFSPGSEDISFDVSEVTRDRNNYTGKLQLKFKRLIFPGMKELGRDLPEDIVKYVYAQDTQNAFEKTLWLGDHHYNNGKIGLTEAMRGTMSYDFLGQEFRMPLYDTAEPEFLGRDVKRHEDLNEILKGFIHLNLYKNVSLIYSMDC